ncbi:hypothetical protein KEM56_005186 [Ascosphaera pollenicola]|nr:hypothetical protein KEM56_005186 [Ascosphaera pollenicola]
MPIYAFGSNGSGQLGIGHKEDVSHPTRCLFRDDTGRATTGKHANAIERAATPVKVAAGGNHTLVLFSSGAAFAAGALGDALFEDKGVMSIRMMQAGEADAGGDGGDSVDPECAFRRVSFKDPVSGAQIDRFKDLSATWDASFFVTSSGAGDDEEDANANADVVYACGIGSKGELGLGEAIVKAEQPTRIHDFPPVGLHVLDIAGCMGHIAAVLSDGSAYGWGASRKGQLGISNVPAKTVWRPSKIAGPGTKATSVVCGREFTVLVHRTSAEAGEPFTFLGPENDRWGISSLKNVNTSSLDIGDETRFAASWHNVYIHKEDKLLLAWGRNDRGQIPTGASFADAAASAPTRVKSLAVGSEHILALTEDVTVLAAGWGEHGNCGPDTDADGDVKGRWAIIDFRTAAAAGDTQVVESEKVIGLGAGCATSWILTQAING